MRVVVLSFGLALMFCAPSQAMGADFTGQWRSDFGIVDLQQQGRSVRGSYSCCDGTIEGEALGNALQFEWRDPVYGAGWGRFTLAPDGDSFDGQWGTADSTQPNGTWHGERLVERSRRGEPSDWTVAARGGSGTLKGEARLYVEGNSVSGWIKGVYILSLAIEGGPPQVLSLDIVNELEGRISDTRMHLTWTNPLQGSAGTMELVAREPGRSIEGTWQAEDGTGGTIAFTAAADIARSDDTAGATAPDLGATSQSSRQAARAETLLREAANLVDAGSYERAHETYRKAEALFRATGDTNKTGYALYGGADADLRRGHYEAARQGLAEVLELGPSVDETIRMLAEQQLWLINNVILKPSSENLAAPGAGSAAEPLPETLRLKEEAQTRLRQGDYAGAVPLIESALDAYRREAATSSPALQTGAQISIGGLLRDAAWAHFHLDQVDQAIARLEEAVDLWRELGSLPNVAGTLGLIGQFALQDGRVDVAIDRFQKAAAAEQLLDSPDAWLALHGLARAYEGAGRLDEAEQSYRAAIDQIERLRAGLVTDESKIGFLEWRSNPYEDLVDLLMARGGDARALQALELAERARGRALLDSLGRATQSVPASSADIRTFGEIANPAVTETLGADEILRRVRGGKTTYLAYFVTESAAHVWVVTPAGEVAARSLSPGRSELERMIGRLRADIDAQFDDRPASLALFDAVVAPIEPALLSSAGAALTILPHGPLHLLSFAALRLPDGGYLGERHALTVLPGFSFLPHLAAPAIVPGARLLAVGKPAGAVDLAASEVEVAAVSGLFDKDRTTALLGRRATRAAVLAELPRHDVVLFSTHGRQREDDSASYYLELADGERLAREEIQELDLQGVRLVVLSACETHVGRLHAGDELMSLSRAFLAAGADAVLVTLWQADEYATAAIVGGAIARLGRGQALGRALQESQLTYLAGLEHAVRGRPWFWAPWLVVGTAA